MRVLLTSIYVFAALVSNVSGQGAPELSARHHFLNDFSLVSIGLVLLFVMAVMVVRKLWRTMTLPEQTGSRSDPP